MSTNASAASLRSKTEFVAIVSILIGLAPFGVDMYLPAFPTLEGYFAVDPGRVQLTLGLFFYGLALGQVLYGPLSDILGRRIPLIFGLGLFITTSIGCALAPNIEAFMALRVLQALGVGAAVVTARAIVRDFFEGNEAARIYSVQMTVTSLAPMVAPLVGSLLLPLGWQSIFLAQAAIGAAMLIAALWRLPPLRKGSGEKLRIRPVASAYWFVLRDRVFLTNALAGGTAMGVMFAYISASPFVFVVQFGLSETMFGWIFGLSALGISLGAMINSRLTGRVSLMTLSQSAGLVQAGAAVLLLGATAVFPQNVLITIVTLFFCIASVGLITPNTTALAMQGHPQRAGSASALLGGLQFFVAALVNSSVSVLGVTDSRSLAVVIICCAAISVCLQASRRRKKAM